LHPLVDSERFRRHIEAAYLAAWEICQRGNSPRSFRSDADFDIVDATAADAAGSGFSAIRLVEARNGEQRRATLSAIRDALETSV
jgi:hypothetical protein